MTIATDKKMWYTESIGGNERLHTVRQNICAGCAFGVDTKMLEEYIDTIASAPLFEGIHKDSLLSVLRSGGAYIKKYYSGEYIFFDFENIHKLGVVLTGEVRAIKEDIWGNGTIVSKIPEKEQFGETFACGKNKAAAITFMAARDSTVLFVPFDYRKNTTDDEYSFHSIVTQNLVALIADKNRRLMEKIEVISKKTLREKILAYLSLQAQNSDSMYFEIEMNRSELAQYLCADRSALTRELASLKDDGLIDYDKNTFRLFRME